MPYLPVKFAAIMDPSALWYKKRLIRMKARSFSKMYHKLKLTQETFWLLFKEWWR
jgi:hypothetical protein